MWTLFIADVVSSGNPSTLNSWSLQIIAVPEPGINVLLAGLAFAAIASRKWKSWK
jgi:PEP-CTERM motif